MLEQTHTGGSERKKEKKEKKEKDPTKKRSGSRIVMRKVSKDL